MNALVITELPAWNTLTFTMTDELRRMLEDLGPYPSDDEVHSFCLAYDLEYHRQANQAGALYVLDGRGTTRNRARCDVCGEPMEAGQSKYWLSFGRDTGWRKFCPRCTEKIEA